MKSYDLHLVFVDHLTETKKGIQKFIETRDSRYIYQNNYIKVIFNMAWLMEILKTAAHIENISNK